jgi:thiosulfate dehydrogenase [quinone] large subunit
MSDATMAPVNGTSVSDDPITSNAGRIWAGISRLLLGFVFLWAFLDKNFGLGYTTPSENAWQFGTGDGNPTAGFLKFGTNPEGPLADFFTGLAPDSGSGFINWLFMFALLGAGVALMLGIFMRIACVGGGILLLSMYLAEAPWAKVTLEDGTVQASNNPLIDDHIVYGAVLLLLMFVSAGRYLGLGRLWEEKVPSFLA